jgi:hypothetical protein
MLSKLLNLESKRNIIASELQKFSNLTAIDKDAGLEIKEEHLIIDYNRKLIMRAKELERFIFAKQKMEKQDKIIG